jgi:hypothetical protein
MLAESDGATPPPLDFAACDHAAQLSLADSK